MASGEAEKVRLWKQWEEKLHGLEQAIESMKNPAAQADLQHRVAYFDLIIGLLEKKAAVRAKLHELKRATDGTSKRMHAEFGSELGELENAVAQVRLQMPS